MKITKSPERKRYSMLRKGIGFCYREKDGKLTLRNETAWHKINGFWVNTNIGCFWFEFRRTKLKLPQKPWETKCTGKEKHRHFVYLTNTFIVHSHAHTVHSEFDFNRLHHHSPEEHANLTVEEMQQDLKNTRQGLGRPFKDLQL